MEALLLLVPATLATINPITLQQLPPPYVWSFNDQYATYKESCKSCGGWEDCTDCTIDVQRSAEECIATLAHTRSLETNGTLASLQLDPGYWRTSDTSSEILACYAASACRGGAHDDYCDEGYKGPCE